MIPRSMPPRSRQLAILSQLLQAGRTSDSPALVLLVREQSPCPEPVCLPGPSLQDPAGLTCRRSSCPHVLWDGPACPWFLPHPPDRHSLASQREMTQEQRDVVWVLPRRWRSWASKGSPPVGLIFQVPSSGGAETEAGRGSHTHRARQATPTGRT